jgi:murein tripeptide amidase MpaA
MPPADATSVPGGHSPGDPQSSGDTRPSLDAIDVLPPLGPWSGASERHLGAPNDAWITAAEGSDFRRTANAQETWIWLRRLVASCADMSIQTIGESAGGRAIDMVVVSRVGFEPVTVRASGKAILLIQACIHAGEVDGKDALLMLLRDIACGRQPGLLDGAVLLLVPILNVDGFADFRPFNRINQRGPREVGRHTNDQNLNLNRDFAKLDAPESRAMVALINAWNPDLYIDTHVTDGADYQYDVTFGSTADEHGWSPHIASWLDRNLLPLGVDALFREGHEPGPLVLAVNDRDLSAGRFDFRANARFTTGYASLRHLPAILIENHSLKTFRRRVLGMYVLLAALIEGIAPRVAGLREAVAKDRDRRSVHVPLGWTAEEPDRHYYAPFKGIRSELVSHEVSGERIPRWTGEWDDSPVLVVPMTKPSASARRPKAYWLPVHLRDVVLRLRLHGIHVDTLGEAAEYRLTRTCLPDAVIGGRREMGIVGTSAAQVLEGRVRVTVGKVDIEVVSLCIPAGSFRVGTDQPLGDLAVVLLEAGSPDSFLQCGFMLGLFASAAYSEPYVLEPLGERMLRADVELRESFLQKLAQEPNFALSAEERRAWILQRTPYADPRCRIYPVLREEP